MKRYEREQAQLHILETKFEKYEITYKSDEIHDLFRKIHDLFVKKTRFYMENGRPEYPSRE